MQTSNRGKGCTTRKALEVVAVFPVRENSPFGLYIGFYNFAEILHAPKSKLITQERKGKDPKKHMASSSSSFFLDLCQKKSELLHSSDSML